MSNKLTAQLSERLEKAEASELLEVILELGQRAEPSADEQPRTRGEKIAALKEAFNRGVAPVEEAVRRVGGEVTGHAWINQTVRARVPASGVKELSEHEQIAAVDTPHPITSDFG